MVSAEGSASVEMRGLELSCGTAEQRQWLAPCAAGRRGGRFRRRAPSDGDGDLALVFYDAVITFPPSGYSLRWYVNAWETHQFGRSFIVSMEVALASTVIGVILGTAAAYGLERGRLPWVGAVQTFLLGPLAIPGVVLGTGLFILFVQIDNAVDFRLVGTLPGLVAAHTLLTIPWTVRLVSASLHGVNRSSKRPRRIWERVRSRYSVGSHCP